MVKIICDSERLPENITRGIKALFIVALHIVGLEVRAHVVYHIEGNVFAVAEIGRSRIPHCMDSLHEALDMCRVILRVKALISRSTKLVQALLAEAKLSMKSAHLTTTSDDQCYVEDIITPLKPTKSKTRKQSNDADSIE